MLERTVVLVLMSLGARIAFNADKTKLFDDLQAVKPTQFLGDDFVCDFSL
jgi:long-subunit acyl-CoA synthetase (AMP-forming)